MNIENHVCSLEYSKKLLELGVNIGSRFVYQNSVAINGEEKYIISLPYISLFEEAELNQTKVYPTFLASELMQMLPLINGACMEIRKGFTLSDGIVFGTKYGYSANVGFGFIDKNPCNSLAKMLIYLIENKLVKVEDINSGM